jgi:NPCBM/NEW2 domain
MISIVFLLSIVWLGFVLDAEFGITGGDFLVRLAAAITLGCFWSAWLVYLLAWCSSGLHLWTVIDALGLILLFNFYAWRTWRRDFAWFSSLLTFDRRFWRTYFIFPVVVTALFIFGVWISREGDILYQGNFTDLAFHMSTTSAFLEQSAFPPLNPQFAPAKLSYHFMADFFAAILCRGGFSLFYGMKAPMVLFAFSLSALTCHFFHVILKRSQAAVYACILFLFGHVGFFNLVYGLAGHPVGNGPLSLGSWSQVEDHLIYPYFNFLNVVIDFFEPQPPFLYGFPLALLALLILFRKYSRPAPTDRGTYFVIALVALLPLFHMHSFLVLAPLLALFLLSEGWLGPIFATARDPGAYPAAPDPDFCGRVSVKVVAVMLAGLAVVLQFAFILSQRKAPGFSAFDVGDRLGALPEIPTFLHAQRLWFWIRAAGMPFVLGLTGFFLAPTFQVRRQDADRRVNLALLALFAITSGYFVLINFYRFTPNWGDSNKFFLYWDLLLCLYAGRLLARLAAASRPLKAAAWVLLLLGAIIPTALELSMRWQRGPSTLFTACDRATADWIRQHTPPDAVFLTANTYTHYVPALAGRRVVNGSYTRETGFADDAIEALVSRAYREANPAVISTVPVNYLVVGPDEMGRYHVSRAAMARRQKLIYEENCRGLRYAVYEVRPVSPEQLAEDQKQSEAKGYVWLSELDPASVQQFGNLQYDESFNQTPLTLNGKTYAAGLGTHAPSEIKFELNGKYQAFQSDLGVDDSEIGSVASVIFRVNVDGKIVYSSDVLKAGAPHQTVNLDLTGAQMLTLLVEDAGDGNHNDHADWAEARLVAKK